MIDDVQNTLRDIVGSATHLNHPAGPSRTFELYVMTGIPLALRTHGYEVWVRCSDGTRVRLVDRDRCFVQRGGVSAGIASATDGPNNASSIVFRRGRRPVWELLNSVLFEGRNATYHGNDVSLVPEAVAVTLRNSGGRSPLGQPRISFECKHVGTSGSADEMRALIMRLYDKNILRGHLYFKSIGSNFLVSSLNTTIAPAGTSPDSFNSSACNSMRLIKCSMDSLNASKVVPFLKTSIMLRA